VRLTREESQALTFIGAMILISIVARMAGRPGPVEIHGAEVSIAELQQSSLALMEPGAAASTVASLGWVNLNTATEAQIAAMPKVGAAAAAIVVETRAQTGGTLDVDALRQAGLKKAALEALVESGSFGTWDDPGRMTPPPGVAALQEPQRPSQRPRARSGQRPTPVRGRATPPTRPQAPVVVRRGTAQEKGGPAATTVAINDASLEELQRLPGVGPALAERIVDYRSAHGPFRTLADLDSVPGIGPALIGRLGPLVRF
jgi:competence ComEA-like helix-hairpin-helix protein